ncbi:hypothetical protein A8B98_04925 [Hymenobacter sp. UV11]|nr:hypothetical protein A8B98_04925 [Hymenobacter sp. UV11]
MPFLTWGQQATPTGFPIAENGFSNKTFLIGEAGGKRPSANDVHDYFIFQPDGRALFRETRGTTVLKDSPLGWRLAGDSLYFLPSAVTLEAAGKTQRIEREAIKYAVTKVSGGYLLKRKEEQRLLTEVQ